MRLAGELPELAALYRGQGPVSAAPPLFRAALLDNREHVMRVLRALAYVHPHGAALEWIS